MQTGFESEAATSAVPTVLDRADPSRLVREPFPHIVVRDAIDAEWCRKLVDSYPETRLLGARRWRRNKRWDMPAHLAVGLEGISQPWKDFLSAHVSNAFYQRVIDIFGEVVLEAFPGLAASVDELRALRTGVRGADAEDRADLLLDAQISGNTPVRSPSRVIGPHVDHPNKLFAGLFYLRCEGDEARGGDLQILRPRTPGFRFHAKRSLRDAYASVVHTVEYDTNVLVMFLNGRMSWHSVTPRAAGPYPRLFMNLLGEACTPLFRVEPREGRIEQTLRTFGIGRV